MEPPDNDLFFAQASSTNASDVTSLIDQDYIRVFKLNATVDARSLVSESILGNIISQNEIAFFELPGCRVLSAMLLTAWRGVRKIRAIPAVRAGR